MFLLLFQIVIFFINNVIEYVIHVCIYHFKYCCYAETILCLEQCAMMIRDKSKHIFLLLGISVLQNLSLLKSSLIKQTLAKYKQFFTAETQHNMYLFGAFPGEANTFQLLKYY